MLAPCWLGGPRLLGENTSIHEMVPLNWKERFPHGHWETLMTWDSQSEKELVCWLELLILIIRAKWGTEDHG